MPETGFLVIADLTGYTAYLSRSELEHAPAIAGDLLETIVGRLDPPFRLAKFEGDAAFLYGPVVATADLEAAEGGTRSRVRWASQAEGVPAADEVSRIQDERAAAYARLGKIAACSMPVIQ